MREGGRDEKTATPAEPDPEHREKGGSRGWNPGESPPAEATISSTEAATVSRPTRIFFADTLEAALAQARRELGPEALLLEVGPASPADSGRGAFRVVCAESGAFTAGGSGPAPSESQHGEAGLVGSEIRQRLDRLERTLELLAGAVSASGLPAVLREPARLLEYHDFAAAASQELVASVRMALTGEEDNGSVVALLAREICRRVRFRAGLEGLRRPAVVVLAGPPGAGKTSALVKMAMREAVARRRTAAILSTDSFRVAASEQLRTYAAILGLPFALAETPAALRQAVAENAARDLILVDTPGFGRGEQDWASEWARMLEGIPGRETLLVLPASLRTAEMLEAMKWWSLFSPSALLVTRLDETDRIGGWVSAAMESNLPVCFFSTGQRIPEDFEEASEARIWEALGGRRGRAAAAASAVRLEP